MGLGPGLPPEERQSKLNIVTAKAGLPEANKLSHTPEERVQMPDLEFIVLPNKDHLALGTAICIRGPKRVGRLLHGVALVSTVVQICTNGAMDENRELGCSFLNCFTVR